MMFNASSRRYLGTFAVLATLLLIGSGCAPAFLVLPVTPPGELEETTVQEGSSGKIAIIEVEGMLLNARTGGLLQAQENPLSLFNEQLRKAAEEKDVKAVVLRINSPGGSVTASDVMYQTVVRFREQTRKPVIAAIQDVGASGGYYVACAADEMIAEPTSIVGSIGVIFYRVDVSGTMGMIGVRTDTIKSGPNKDMGSPFRPATPAELELMQEMVNDYYGRFVKIVKERRGITDDMRLSLVTDGRVFTGESAKAKGLLDATGSLDDAIDLARSRSGSPNASAVIYRRPYGYTGSIYAKNPTPPPGVNVVHLDLLPRQAALPAGFYYLWEP